MFKFMSARSSTVAQAETQKLPQAIDASEYSLPKPVSLTSSKSPSRALNSKDIVTVKEGDIIPFDGRIREGVALVDESALVGVSTPALLSDETGRNNVIGGTLIVEGTLKIQRA
jgi:P-type E1-E2 ATPase